MTTTQKLFTVSAGLGFATLTALPASADLLVDFEETADDNNTLPAGFVSLAASSASGTLSRTFNNVAAPGVGIGNQVNIIVSTDGTNGVQFFDRNPVTTSGDDLDALARDFVFVSKEGVTGGSANGIIITIAGIAAGTYNFTGYFHDGRTAELDQGVVDVFVNTGSGESLALDDVDYTFGDTIATLASGSFQFTANGSDDVIFRIDNPNTQGNGAHVINGFAIAVVPEPGSLALLGIGGLLIARRRRSS